MVDIFPKTMEFLLKRENAFTYGQWKLLLSHLCDYCYSVINETAGQSCSRYPCPEHSFSPPPALCVSATAHRQQSA